MQRWYWCGQSSNMVSVDETGEGLMNNSNSAAFEPTVSDRNIGIKIHNLTKVFSQVLLARLMLQG